jgi:hypothetical protein
MSAPFSFDGADRSAVDARLAEAFIAIEGQPTPERLLELVDRLSAEEVLAPAA